MPAPKKIKDEIDIPNSGSPISVTVVSGTPAIVRYRIELHQPPLAPTPIANATGSGTAHKVGSPENLIQPEDTLLSQVRVFQGAAGNTDWKIHLVFKQGATLVGKSSVAQGKFSSSVALVDLVFITKFL